MAGSATLMTLPSRNDTKDARIAIQSTSLCVRADGRELTPQANTRTRGRRTLTRTQSPATGPSSVQALLPVLGDTRGRAGDGLVKRRVVRRSKLRSAVTG